MKIPKDFEIVLVVDGESITINPRKDFDVSEDNFDHSLEETPPVYAYLIGLQAKLLKQLSIAREKKDSLYSKLYMISKTDYEGSRPPSDEYVGHEIMGDETYRVLLANFIEVDSNYKLISGILSAFQVRLDILRTLSANRRKENG